LKTWDFTALRASAKAVPRSASRRGSPERIKGRARASSELELDQELAAKGLVLLHARPASSRQGKKGLRLERAELLRLMTQLAATVGGGLPLLDGLQGLGHRMETERGRLVVADLVAGLESGEGLSIAMARHPRAFPGVVVSSVRAGEASGELAKVLTEVARHLEGTANLRAQALQALLYPTILMSAVLGLVVVLLTYVLPRIVGLYPDGHAGLPLETRVVLELSDALVEHGLLLAGVLLASGAALLIARKRPAWRARLHAALLSLPRIGRLLGQIATARFASTASTLQAAGCDAFAMLRIAGDTCGNAALAGAFRRTSEGVRQGETLTSALERERLIDPLLVQMVSVGERTGDLDRCLQRVTAYYDEEVPRTVKRLVTLLEPLLLVAAGAVVAFILLAALLPLFDLYGSIG
jgi:type II secretory pathway component PulF